MRVAVVAYEMEGDRTGVGRYLEGLLGGVAELGGPAEWYLFFKGEPFEHPLWQGASSCCRAVFDHRPRAHPVLWEQLRLPRLLRRHAPDLLFSPSYSLPPLSGVPAVVTVHDLSFLRLPGDFSFRERWRRRLLARGAVRRARVVLADTPAVARDLAASYGLGEGRVQVVPLGLDPVFRPSDDPPAEEDRRCLAALGVGPPYLLSVGSILPRRRLDLVLAAFGALAPRHPELRLVLAGPNRLPDRSSLAAWIAASGAGDRVVELGWVDDGALPSLYRRATASFYLSPFEGFGLPPLEALACGTPAVVTAGQAIDDLWPDYPYRCVPLDRSAVIEAVERVLSGGEVESVRRKAAARLKGLSWRRSAERFVALLEGALDSAEPAA